MTLREHHGPIGEFQLSITQALADQLEEALGQLERASLSEIQALEVQERPGVYELFWQDQRVYVGKAAKSLRQRLTKHQRKLSGRHGISASEVLFQCLYVDVDLDAAAPEKMLIRRYKGRGEVSWNTNGFGNNDPGRNRDKSKVKRNHFDAQFPAATETVLTIEPREWSLNELLPHIKAQLPFLFRFSGENEDATVYRSTHVQLESPDSTFSEIIEKIISAIPDGWQITLLPGYAIMYPEIQEYKSARELWQKANGQVRHDVLTPTFGGAKEIEEEPLED